MKQTITAPSGSPTANLAINKSRIKIYKNAGSLPTYYLEKGQEFSIELFNPTSDTILAKIHLNGNAIAQGGLVLRPGERVFLDRYIDVAKKFVFDTYEVSNSAEVRKAIEDNGDFKVEFYKESIYNRYPHIRLNGSYNQGLPYQNYHNGYYNSGTPLYRGDITTSNSGTFTGAGSVTLGLTNGIVNCGASTSYNTSAGMSYTSEINSPCLDSLNDEIQVPNKLRTKSLKSKSIETGRVEMGEESSQKLQTVSKTFDSYAFHTVSYKMLPLSQKVNSTEDLNVKRYCTNCGAKQKANYKFCPTCGSRA